MWVASSNVLWKDLPTYSVDNRWHTFNSPNANSLYDDVDADERPYPYSSFCH